MSRLFITLIFFSIILLLAVFLIWPRYQNLRSLQLEVGGKQIALRNIERKISHFEELNGELEKYESDLIKIGFALPSEPDFPSLLYFLQKTSSHNGLSVEGINPSLALSETGARGKTSKQEALEKGGKIKGLITGLSLSGSYDAFLNFLSALEMSARLVEVEAISFSTPAEGGIFSFGLSIKAHSY